MKHRHDKVQRRWQRVRTVFLSDTHLGCQYSHTEALLEFLNHFEPDHLYLVGDIIDGWQLRQSWYWDETCSAIVRRILELLDNGTYAYYTPGNHDEFLRQFVRNAGRFSMADEFVHLTTDGRRLFVTHGDQFDAVVRHGRWLSLISDNGYSLLLWLNRVFNACRQRLGLRYWSLSACIKRKLKQATSAIARFENAAIQHAQDQYCDGIVCGHIHTPIIHEQVGITYYNTGDWVENCTALVEHISGALRLVRYPRDLSKAFQESDDNLKLTGSTPHIAESAWRNHGEDLLQPVGGRTRTCDPSANHGGGLKEPT